MFEYATAFNQPVSFDSSKIIHIFLSIYSHRVTAMASMFSHAESFNQNVTLDTSNVVSMSGMFAYATNLNQPINFIPVTSIPFNQPELWHKESLQFGVNFDNDVYVLACHEFQSACEFRHK